MVSRLIRIEDMRCEGCAGRARRALLAVSGVVKVIASLDDHTAEVTFDEFRVCEADLSKALFEAGFNRPEDDVAPAGHVS